MPVAAIGTEHAVPQVLDTLSDSTSSTTANDNLIPCKEAGLMFSSGDILQIVNQEDVNWWQARHVEGGSAGLIPSQLLEEKRKAFVKRDVELSPAANLCSGMVGKKKKKMMYLTTKNAGFDRHELLIYEEVAKVPPFRRKTLILIGAPGVGRRSLKNKLLVSDPQHYGVTIPYTSRKAKSADRENMMYAFTSRSKMEADIKAGRYLEHGEYDGNLYGIKIDSIHEVVEAGRICILDVNPQTLKVLRTSEFLPYVVFIKAPEFEVLKAMNRSGIEAGVATKRKTDAELKKTIEESAKIQRVYGHYFDLTIVNDDLEEAYSTLKSSLEKLKGVQQWVPVGWVF
nr:Mpp2a protein [Danio rerio]